MHKANIFLKKDLWIYFILFTLALIPDLSGYQEKKVSEEETVLDLRKLRKALIAYEVKPTEENARRLLQAIPEKPPTREIGGRDSDKTLLDLVGSELFTNNVIAGDEYLAEAAFRLHSYIGGGHVLEELEIMLGQMLVKKPVLFLRLLNKYKQNYRSTSEYPLVMTEILDIVSDIESEEDSIRRAKEELWLYIKRIRSLKSVQDPGYMELRDECIQVIRSRMDWLYGSLLAGKVEEIHPDYYGGLIVEKIFIDCGDDIVCSFRKLNRAVGSYLRDEPYGKYYLAALENVIYFLDRIIGSPDCDRDIKRIREEAAYDFEEMHKTLKIVYEWWRGTDSIVKEALRLFEYLYDKDIVHEAREP